jgi:hypothetical protein
MTHETKYRVVEKGIAMSPNIFAMRFAFCKDVFPL